MTTNIKSTTAPILGSTIERGSRGQAIPAGASASFPTTEPVVSFKSSRNPLHDTPLGWTALKRRFKLPTRTAKAVLPAATAMHEPRDLELEPPRTTPGGEASQQVAEPSLADSEGPVKSEGKERVVEHTGGKAPGHDGADRETAAAVGGPYTSIGDPDPIDAASAPFDFPSESDAQVPWEDAVKAY